MIGAGLGSMSIGHFVRRSARIVISIAMWPQKLTIPPGLVPI